MNIIVNKIQIKHPMMLFNAFQGLRIVTGNRPRAQWPEEGKLAIKKMSVTYREGLEPVLKSITCTFNSKEKVKNLSTYTLNLIY